MTDTERERCERATPGPWWILPDTTTPDLHVVIGDQDDRVCTLHSGECLPAENAVFLSRARDDVPYLLALVERLTAEVERLQASIERRESS